MNIFNTIKSQLSIVDVVSEYATLKKAGSYYKGQCPFHSERTASFTVTPHKEIFYCFGCHLGGDVIAFIAHTEKCSPREAAHHLAERYQLTLPAEEQQQGRGAAWQAQQRHYILCGHIATWCAEQLRSSSAARAYLAGRAINQESITRFGLGFMPGGERARRELLWYLQKEGFLAQDLIALRYFIDGRQGLYSPFEQRIIFPIRDHLSRHCGFGGRIFEEGDTRAKYYNSHDHAYFSKGSILFGFDLAKRSMQHQNSVNVVEGYTDCIAMAQAGILNVVATLGTACTTEHLKLIARHATHLRVVYDNDPAGVQACLRLTSLCWESSLELAVVTLPTGEDPANYLANGGAFGALLEEDIFAFYLRLLRDTFAERSLPEKLEHIRELLNLIAKITDPLKRDIVLSQAANACGLPQATLAKELRRLAGSPGIVTLPKAHSQKIKSQSEITVFTRSLFCAILNSYESASLEDERMLITLLPEPLKELFLKLQAYKRETSEYYFSNFFVTLNDEERRCVTALLVQDVVGDEQQAHQGSMGDLIVHAQKRYWKQAVKFFKQELQEAQQQHDQDRMTTIVQKFTMLKKYMQQRGIL